MKENVLQSRLLAACKNTGIPFQMDESNVSLAKKLVEAEEWDAFSRKYEMIFDQELEVFIDIPEMASVYARAQLLGLIDSEGNRIP